MKAILFDFDGTIIDSQPLINGYLFYLLKKKGVELNKHEKFILGGVSLDDTVTWLNENKNVVITPLEVLYHKIIFRLFYLRKIKPFYGVRELLLQVKALGYKTAIVTNSPRKYTKYLIRANELQECFDYVVGVDDVGAPKPDPKMLMVAATHLGVPYKNCIMVDDHEPGIIAGKKLGMKTIEITKNKKTKADISLQTIYEITSLIRQ